MNQSELKAKTSVPSAGEHITSVKRGKTCSERQARESMQRAPGAGKHVTVALYMRKTSQELGQDRFAPDAQVVIGLKTPVCFTLHQLRSSLSNLKTHSLLSTVNPKTL